MTVQYRYIGKGKTDANGVAHITEDAEGQELQTPGYLGVGAGLTQIIASVDDDSHISESSLQSETYSLWDCIFYDKAIDNTMASKYINSTSFQVSYSENGTNLKHETATGIVRYWTTVGGNQYWRDENINYCIECDVDYTYGGNNANVAIILGGATIHLGGLNSNQSSGNGKVKLITNGNTIKCYWNGNYVSSMDKTMESNWGMSFQFYRAGNELTFKDLKIYPI